jgi:TrmH family RNA methyltransferase
MEMLESTENPKVRRLIQLLDDKKTRAQEKMVLLEGRKLIEEASHNCTGTIYTTSQESVIPGWQHIIISEKIAKRLSRTEHSENVFAEVPIPPEAEKMDYPLIALDAVSDPGNMGTLLRTACAFGYKGVLLLPGSVDPFNSKVLRSSKGALFKLAYKHVSWKQLEDLAQYLQLRLLGADLRGQAAKEIEGNRFVLILGNEGSGLSEEGKRLTEKISLPMKGDMESLNVSVAGGILMYLLSNHP